MNEVTNDPCLCPRCRALREPPANAQDAYLRGAAFGALVCPREACLYFTREEAEALLARVAKLEAAAGCWSDGAST